MKARLWVAVVIGVVAVGFAGVAAASQRGGGGGGSAGGIPVGLLKDLGSEDFATRAAAQKALDQVPASRREELSKLAAGAEDPEVKARLLARVAEFEEEAILNPPTISFDLKQANLSEAIAALSKAVNVPMIGRDPNDGSGNAITLSMKDASFCQVVAAIGAQTQVAYSPTAYGVSVVGPNKVARPQPFPPPQACGPILFFPQGMLSGQTVNFGLTIIVDPRLQTLGLPTLLLAAKDEKGNDLAVLRSNSAGLRGSGPIGPEDYARINYSPWSVVIGAPEDLKSKITLKGEAQIRVVTRYARATINDPEKHLRESMKVGGSTVSILEFGLANQQRSTNVRISATGVAAGSIAGDAAVQDLTDVVPVWVSLVDATGRQIANISASGMVVKSIPQVAMDEAKGPFRVEIAAPLKWKTIKVPVELKGLEIQAMAAGARGRRGE